MQNKLFILFLCLPIWGCGPDVEVIDLPVNEPTEGKKNSLDNRDKTGEKTRSREPDSLFRDDADDLLVVEELVKADETGEIKFPALTFDSQGYTTYKLKDRLPMSTTVTTIMKKDSLTLTKSGVAISCGDLDGCDQGDVNDEAKKLNGSDVYTRTQREELQKLGGQHDVYYAIFADVVLDGKGRVFKFDQPLPVYPLPASKSRYEDLRDGPKTYTSEVEISESIPGGNGKTDKFTVSIEVSLQSSEDSVTRLQFLTTIDNDDRRRTYGQFPIPRKTTFSIDTDERAIESIQMESWYFGSKSDQEEETISTLKLCSVAIGDELQQFPCK